MLFKNQVLLVNQGDSFTIPLLRSNGVYGNISVIETITDGTAINSVDYVITSLVGDVQSTASSITRNLTFNDGANYTSVQVVNILPSNKPTQNLTFVITIASTSGGAQIGTANTLTVVILAHDHPFGLVGFANLSSPSSPVYIPIIAPGTVALQFTVNIARQFGLIGDIVIYWSIDQQYTSWITPSNGSVSIGAGTSSASISASTIPSVVPHGPLTVNFYITSTQGGADILPSASTATVFLPANNDPYGVVNFNPVSPVSWAITPSGRVMTVSLVRSAGLLQPITATVSLAYSTSGSNAGCTQKSWLTSSINISFSSDQALSSASITIADDAVLTSFDQICLGLSVALTSGGVYQTPSGTPSPRVASTTLQSLIPEFVGNGALYLPTVRHAHSSDSVPLGWHVW